MNSFSVVDLIAAVYFFAFWLGHYTFSERSPRSLNSIMARRRLEWMRRMAAREARMPDAIAMTGLQNGSAFFASTSLIAIGGAFAALGASAEAIEVFSALPFGIVTTREAYDIKVLTVVAMLTYAFYKFVWSYRLFNYGSILVVCAPPPADLGSPEMEIAIQRAARMNIEAGSHFNRGLRSLFFTLALIGWFVNPWALIVTVTLVTVILHRRQFGSEAVKAASLGD